MKKIYVQVTVPTGERLLMSQAEMRLELDEFEETLVILRDFRMQLLIDVYLEDVCVKIITYTVQESGVDFFSLVCFHFSSFFFYFFHCLNSFSI